VATTDSIKFLQQITNILSNRFQENGGKLIAISGSNGKTTTKEMLFHLLHSIEPQTICTQKNNNNHIGVPLTLLQINKNTKYAIIELGSNHPGEIKTLCEIVNPAIGLTTNIGDTHLEFFNNRENVFIEEGYLYCSILNCEKKNKIFFKNTDDELLETLSYNSFVHEFGCTAKESNFIIEKEYSIVHNNGHEYKITNKYITGKHNFHNLCLAFIVAKSLDSTRAKEFVSLCESFKPTTNRSEWLEVGKSKIFLDAYNANPSSMIAAIEGFLGVATPSSCLIIGDMNELGVNEISFHQQTAKFISLQKAKKVIFVGRFAQAASEFCAGSEHFDSAQHLKEYFSKSILNTYKYIFIKGSRSLQLESILDITSH
jgi:UDP-N-acetylmuramoyl-tripeptide--D-alanyl-D-alanine ligase